MDHQFNIIQWNCRGLKANFTDFDILLNSFSPAALCLQETLQSDLNPIKLRHYTQYCKNYTKADGSPYGGVTVMVKNSIPQSEIILQTALQATAVRVTLHRTITICSIYLPPNKPVLLKELVDLLMELPDPVLLMGILMHTVHYGETKH